MHLIFAGLLSGCTDTLGISTAEYAPTLSNAIRNHWRYVNFLSTTSKWLMNEPMICTLTSCARDLCCQGWQLTQSHGPSTTNWYFRKPTWRVSERTLIHWFIFGKAELISPSHDVPDCFSIHPCIHPSIFHQPDSTLRNKGWSYTPTWSQQHEKKMSKVQNIRVLKQRLAPHDSRAVWGLAFLSRHDSSIVHPNEQTPGHVFLGRVPC